MGEVRQLFLLRHAKSSWQETQLDDHDRPLATRGRKAAKSMAEHIHRAGIQPELVLCSSAVRARETLDALSVDGEIRIERDLYGASPNDLLDRLRRVPAAVESAMLIGHNPGIQDLAVCIAGGGVQLPQVRRKFPTGTLATLTFSGQWDGLVPGSAELVAFVRPKELD